MAFTTALTNAAANSHGCECLCQININNKKGYIIVLYRPPSQTSSEFRNFQHNLDKILSDVKQLRSTFLIILDNFNAKSKTWWTHDITTNQGVQIESLTSTYNLHHLISDPPHILPNSSLCTDLIINDQPNLVVDSGVHASLHPNYHHQVTYYKFNLFIDYPPLYEWHVWDYKHADSRLVQSKNHSTKLTGINYSKTKMSMNK